MYISKQLKQIFSIALFLIVLMFSCTQISYAQRGPYFNFGNVSNSLVKQAKDSGFTNARVLYEWKDIEPTKGGYLFTAGILPNLQKLVDSGFTNIRIEVATGPGAPITGAADWLVSVDGIGTYTTTGGNDPGPYPNYYSLAYKTAWYNLHDTLARFLGNLPTDIKSKIKSWFIKYGSTGDTGPHKGTPTSTAWGITDDETWVTYYKILIDSANKKRLRYCADITLSLNPSNDNKDLNYYNTTYSGSWMKWGDATHNYLFDGEALPKISGLNYWGEIQGSIPDEVQEKPTQFIFFCAARALGITQFDIPQGTINSLHIDKFSLQWFKDHAYDDTRLHQGYIYLFDKKSIDDTINYPTSVFGALIDPARLTAYNNRVNSINASSYDQLYKNFLIMESVKANVNPSRVNLMYNNLYEEATHSTSLYWDNDYGYSLTDNYGLNVRQINSRQTSVSGYRRSANSYYGRADRGFKIVSGAGEMLFSLNQNLKKQGTDKQRMQFDIVYYDTSTVKWQLTCAKCGKRRAAATVTNTNSRTYKTLTVTVSDFQFGGKLTSGADFGIKYAGGPAISVPVVYINVKNIDK